MNAQDQVLAVYQQALKNLESDAPDVADEILVALFDTVKRQQKQLAELTLKVSLLEDHVGDEISDDVLDVISKAKRVLQ